MNFQETAPFSLKDGTYLPQTRHLRTFNSAPFHQRHAVLTFAKRRFTQKCIVFCTIVVFFYMATACLSSFSTARLMNSLIVVPVVAAKAAIRE